MVDELEPEAIVERAMVAMAERGEVVATGDVWAVAAVELPIASVHPSGSDRVRSGEQWR